MRPEKLMKTKIIRPAVFLTLAMLAVK